MINAISIDLFEESPPDNLSVGLTGVGSSYSVSLAEIAISFFIRASGLTSSSVML